VDLTPAQRAALKMDLLRDYARMEQLLEEVIGRPHYKVSEGEVLVGEDGQPVADPYPADRARELLATIRRNREQLTGRAAGDE
jgi:hypothetical protein